MPEAGQILSHYRLVEEIGAGGMGVVWRALDTTLGREVAIKILPAEFAADSERLTRFEREARLLASLNHPNVAAVYGLHKADDVHFIAMELVEGQDLANRIRAGRLPRELALDVARQIADGLEAAHAAGVVHRDLKPANVCLTADGQVKLLDFGLARSAGATDGAGSSPEHSPTITSAGTQLGVVLGTAGYMSPEQARGHIADRRADVWAFGVVLWEMLTGENPFRRETVSDSLAAVLQSDPDPSRLPEDLPESIRRLLRRSLEKDPRRRLRDVADARLELDELPADPSMASATQTRARSVWPWLGGALVGVVLGYLLFAFVLSPAPAGPTVGPVPLQRTSVVVPDITGPEWAFGAVAVAPDASRIAFGSFHGIALRRLDSTEFEPISGAEDGYYGFFSPDSRWMAYFDDGNLMKVPVRGGEPVMVARAHQGNWGTWADDGWIWFTLGESKLARVREDGGPVEELAVDKIFTPRALPGGRGVLAARETAGSASTWDNRYLVHVARDGTVTRILKGGYRPIVLPTGALVFARSDGVYAVRFDLERLEASGSPVLVQPGVFCDSTWSVAFFDVADDGTLVYAPGGDHARSVPTWIDRDSGEQRPLALEPGFRGTFHLSPDNERLVFQMLAAQDQIHVFDFSRNNETRLAVEGSNVFPVWSADGRDVFFASNRDGKSRIYRVSVDGGGTPVRVMSDERSTLTDGLLYQPTSVSPDGKHLLFHTWGHAERNADVWVLPLDGQSAPQPFMATAATEIIAEFSPDGRWVVYMSDKSGRFQIYVRPFPDAERREWQVSERYGFDPRWNPAGGEVLFRRREGVLSVPYTNEPDFSPQAPRMVLETDFHDADGMSFDLTRDGRRFLINIPRLPRTERTELIFVRGWAEEVDRRLRSSATN